MILSAENLSYSYGARVLFENISFNVEEGDKYGSIINVGVSKKSRFQHLFFFEKKKHICMKSSKIK